MSKTKKSDLLKLSYLSHLSVSPQGRYVSWVQSKAKEDKKGYESFIHLYDTQEKSLRQYTEGGKDKHYFWDENKEILYLVGLRDEKSIQKRKEGHELTHIYTLHPQGGEAIKQYEIPKNVGKIRMLSEERFMFTAQALLEAKEPFLMKEEELKKHMADLEDEKDYEVIERIPFWGNGAGYTHNKITRLYIYDGKTDKTYCLSEQLKKNMAIEDFELSKDGKSVVLSYHPIEEKAQVQNFLMVIDWAKEKVLYETEEPFLYAKAFLTADHQIFAMGSDMKTYGVNENPKPYLIDIKENTKKCLHEDLDLGLWGIGTDARLYQGSGFKWHQEKFYFTPAKGFYQPLMSLDLAGNLEEVCAIKGAVDEFAFLEKEIYGICFQENHPQEVYVLGEKIVPITHFNDALMEKRTLISPEHQVYENEAGVSIDYWVMTPAKAKENKKYPVILNIHGGPKSAYGPIYFHEMQYFASEGFMVIFCNPRGSDGKGNDFADIRGQYGAVDYEDILGMLRHEMSQNPQMDAQNLFVTGGSYGGFMTNWIIGHTDIFAAAATQRSISNWLSKFGTTDIGYFFVEDQMKANPWSDAEKMWHHSPMKYLDKAKTPTLVIHSEEDYRCWTAEGFQLFTSLKYHGVESKLVLFRGENHELSRSGRPDHRLRRLSEIVDWFKKHQR